MSELLEHFTCCYHVFYMDYVIDNVVVVEVTSLMSEKAIFICDRCKKEIKLDEDYWTAYISKTESNYDFCTACWKLFLNFMDVDKEDKCR